MAGNARSETQGAAILHEVRKSEMNANDGTNRGLQDRLQTFSRNSEGYVRNSESDKGSLSTTITTRALLPIRS